MDVATLRIQGMSPVALKAEIENRYKNKTYKVPEKAGLSYMVAPNMRTWMLPDWQVHTMPMPHLMFYAPNITNEDIGAVPNSSLLYPSIFKEGIAEQSYIVSNGPKGSQFQRNKRLPLALARSAGMQYRNSIERHYI
jgi:hypothetical protein